MITVVGSLNMDLLIETARLPGAGETVLGRRFRQSPGGKGANQACAAARLGARVAMVGAIGDDAFGRELRASLEDFGVAAHGLVLRRNTPTGLAFIVVDVSGQNQIVVASGANGTLTARDIEDQAGLLEGSQAIVVQLEIPLAAAAAALRLGRAAGALTILNPAPALRLPDEVLGFCDWLVPNEVEASSLAGRPVRHPEEARGAAAALRERAPHLGVLITLGARGAWLECGGVSMWVPPLPVIAVDTVGAGAAFVGAFAARLAEGASPETAAAFAGAAAALAVTRPGAQAGLPTRAEVESLLPRKKMSG